jgi:hypothetical protein
MSTSWGCDTCGRASDPSPVGGYSSFANYIKYGYFGNAPFAFWGRYFSPSPSSCKMDGGVPNSEADTMFAKRVEPPISNNFAWSRHRRNWRELHNRAESG